MCDTLTFMDEKIIPTHADSYDTLSFVHMKCVSVYKKIGYTPLQVVEDIRPYLLSEEASSCTYVGRLDPMAEGWMHVLWSGDAEEKEKLLKLQKTYEVDIIFGMSTDTGDVLGMVVDEKNKHITEQDVISHLTDFVGPFTYAYPTYSSPHMKKTLQGLEQEHKKQKGHIYTIEFVSGLEVSGELLQEKIIQKLSLVRMYGDFRIDTVRDGWRNYFIKHAEERFFQVTIRVTCGSGTYMRTLAEELGNKLHVSACAFSIRRIGIHM
jgi:tRNA pseudouridine(55) synthase